MTKQYKAMTLHELWITAARRGCVLVAAKPNELLLDLDEFLINPTTPQGAGFRSVDEAFIAWRDQHQPILNIIAEKFGDPFEKPEIGVDPLGFECWASRGGRLHVKVLLHVQLKPVQAVALQAALGSDPTREAIAVWEFAELEERGISEDTRSLFRPKG